MAESAIIKFVYFYYYLVDNNIGSSGLKLLTKASLPILQKLWLGNTTIYIDGCYIGDEGAKHVTKAEWVNLQ